MCGRYSLSTPADLVAEIFDLEAAPQLAPRYNIAPTQEAPIVRASADGGRVLRSARWGLVPAWAKEVSIGQRTINARSESVAETRSFRDSFRHRRCLVPADGFYEWQARAGGKQPFHLTLADGSPFAFAGLYDLWRRAEQEWLESFTILTTRPNPLVAPIHDRMPVILPRAAHRLWLDPAVDDPDRLRPLLEPYPAEEMLATAVGRFVNSPHNEGPRCVEQVALAPEPRNLSLWD